MTRETALRVAVLAYLALLVVAAIPAKLAPEWLDAPGARARRLLASASIVPGLAIFSGPVTAVHRRASCVVVTATRPDGRVGTLFENPCPPTGFRWRIAPEDELVVGLARLTRIERFVGDRVARGSPDWLKLQALGDYFCHSPLAAPGPRESVALEYRNLLVLYSTGVHSEDRAITCRWRCDALPLATPRCSRAPAPGTLPPAAASRG